ncbi:P-loop containing nucleoside triphosphate hydrolase protein [Macrophomina phaseolina]|uniref:P-loop containing nucleoside triphosphate hydrolase protein n=1 Tax=Macrophomina phaseolina TaxID=35725 RepID=A0ABQ8GUP3_9PEZI|nr:P-loop containing nucleoside triphosphate hydrolase protein [Macrophomina phaseolina]
MGAIPDDESDVDHAAPNSSPVEVITGQQPTIKTVYEGPSKCDCCINWVEEPPTDIGPSIEHKPESKRHALLTRMRRSHDNDGEPFVLDSIVVQSAYLKALLGKVFMGYNGITTSLERLVFKAPFRPFFYEWDRLREAVMQEQDPVSREHGRLLRTTLKADLNDTLALSKDHARNGVITFKTLWTIFRPGIDVYASKEGFHAMYRLAGSTYRTICGARVYRLDLRHVDFDGKGFGYKKTELDIQSFEGTVAVASISPCPADLYPGIEHVRNHLQRRGRLFEELQMNRCSYRSYRGLADLPMDPNQTNRLRAVQKVHVDGRIIIDEDSYSTYNTFERNWLSPLNLASISAKWNVSDNTHDAHKARLTGIHRGPSTPRPPTDLLDESDMEYMLNQIPIPMPMPMPMPIGVQSVQPPEGLLYLCDPQVRGYSFKTKKWASFWVDLIEDVKWNEDAFESLVLPSNHKRLMLSFVDSQIRNKGLFDDVIEGKGQGIVILLEGSPGVGKTLTAEALADRLRKPLYAMSIAELGNTPNDLEARLMMILEMAVRWDAVVLLDESDVFLEKRSADNLHRNGVVAIFLRLLEYFRGVLFMTTNRVRAMDPAFQSRIHLKIQYPELREEARREIWGRMMGLSGMESGLKEGEVEALARLELNGREIKNLVKSAQLLASCEAVPLSMEHIQAVLEVTKRDVVNGSGDAV